MVVVVPHGEAAFAGAPAFAGCGSQANPRGRDPAICAGGGCGVSRQPRISRGGRDRRAQVEGHRGDAAASTADARRTDSRGVDAGGG